LVNTPFAPGARLNGEHLAVQPQHPESNLQRLPLVTLCLTERCNSRCVTCDYWPHGRTDLDLEVVRRMLPSLDRCFFFLGPAASRAGEDLSSALNAHR
jgi:hypothetical protein